MEDTVQSEGPVESFPVSSPSSVMEGTEGWSVVSHVQTDFTVLPGASQKECCGHPALGAHALLWYLPWSLPTLELPFLFIQNGVPLFTSLTALHPC